MHFVQPIWQQAYMGQCEQQLWVSLYLDTALHTCTSTMLYIIRPVRADTHHTLPTCLHTHTHTHATHTHTPHLPHPHPAYTHTHTPHTHTPFLTPPPDLPTFFSLSFSFCTTWLGVRAHASLPTCHTHCTHCPPASHTTPAFLPASTAHLLPSIMHWHTLPVPHTHSHAANTKRLYIGHGQGLDKHVTCVAWTGCVDIGMARTDGS